MLGYYFEEIRIAFLGECQPYSIATASISNMTTIGMSREVPDIP